MAFGIADMNLQEDDSYKYCESATRHERMDAALKELVLWGLSTSNNYSGNNIPDIDYGKTNIVQFTKDPDAGRIGLLYES